MHCFAHTKAGHKLPGKEREQAGLTKTELKILRILPADLSYEEIGFDNNIKISTVRTHIHSIYSKLDVNNRTSAVINAAWALLNNDGGGPRRCASSFPGSR